MTKLNMSLADALSLLSQRDDDLEARVRKLENRLAVMSILWSHALAHLRRAGADTSFLDLFVQELPALGDRLDLTGSVRDAFLGEVATLREALGSVSEAGARQRPTLTLVPGGGGGNDAGPV